MKILDMRGQPCPIPVVNAKKYLAQQAENSSVVVLVDNIVAVQNLEKMAKGTGCVFSYEEDGVSFKVSITRGVNTGLIPGREDLKENPSIGLIVLIKADTMGKGAEELGQLLIKGFIFSLSQLNPPPEAVIFLNSGARLTMEGANTVPDLKMLEEKGSTIYTCGTCVNYYKTRLAVGSIIDMMTITNHLANATSIITI
jgi:selenium metabolism protein YedF